MLALHGSGYLTNPLFRLEIIHGKNETYFDLFCPECGKLNRVDFSVIKDPEKGNFQIDCSCKSSIPISVDFRRLQRKKVNDLDGVYKNFSNGNEKGKMSVIDISINGIGFLEKNQAPSQCVIRSNCIFLLTTIRSQRLKLQEL